MGWKHLTASGTLNFALELTSVIVTPLGVPGGSAWASLYEATAAVSANHVMEMRVGSGGVTNHWTCVSGLRLDKLHVDVNSAECTIVWS